MRRDSGHLVDESSSRFDDCSLTHAMSRTEGGLVSQKVFIERGWDRLSRLGGAYAHRMDVLFSKGGLDDETREWLDSRRELQRTDTSHTHSEDQKAGQQ